MPARLLRAAVVWAGRACARAAVGGTAGLRAGPAGSGLAAAAAVGVLNAVVWPLLARLALPLSVMRSA